MSDDKDEMDVFNMRFQVVKNVSPKLLGDDIIPMIAEEVRKAMSEMFREFHDKTGFKPVIVGDTLPTRVLKP